MAFVVTNPQVFGYSLKFFIAIALCWCSFSFTFAQGCKQSYEQEILPLLRSNQFSKSLDLAKVLAEKCPDFYPLRATLTDLFAEIGDSLQAISASYQLIQDFPDEKRPYQQLVKRLSERGKYSEALTIIHQFEQKFKNQTTDPGWQKKCQQVKWAATQPPSNLFSLATPLPETINTIHDEGLASLSPLEDQLYFTRRVGVKESILISHLTKTYSWSNPVGFEIPETGSRVGAHTFAADGKKVIFTACDRPDSRGRCDLYESILQKDGQWSPPINLGNNINTASWESQPCLSFDGRILIYCSTREGGKGGSDLWMSFQVAEGWSYPINLSSINSSGDEKSPFLHADGKTLFFASNGRIETYGGLDLYVTHYLAERKAWEVPDNLGSSINSPANESGLTINARGTRGLINRSVSNRGEDIFEIQVNPSWKATPMSVVEIRGPSLKNTNFNWTLTDLHLGQSLPDQWLRINDSTVLLAFDVRFQHAFMGKAPGFLPISLSLTDSNPSIQFQEVIPEKISVGKEVTLANIFFKTASSELDAESETELDFLATWIRENPNWKFEIAGHTDDSGKSNDNLILSQKRAEIVKEGLIKRKVSSAVLTAVGYGSKVPAASNDSQEGKAKNRRTVLKVVAQLP